MRSTFRHLPKFVIVAAIAAFAAAGTAAQSDAVNGQTEKAEAVIAGEKKP